jgi:hypothetical protein
MIIVFKNIFYGNRTVPPLWYVQKFQFLAKVKATRTGKLIDSLPRNIAVAELLKIQCGLLP